MKQVKEEAEKEMKRMIEVFEKVEIGLQPKSKEFYEFAKNYFEDGKYFFEQEKFVDSFEAFIISWAYIDIGLKLDFLKIPEEIRKYFTAD